jgi:hypothetical protein
MMWIIELYQSKFIVFHEKYANNLITIVDTIAMLICIQTGRNSDSLIGIIADQLSEVIGSSAVLVSWSSFK